MVQVIMKPNERQFLVNFKGEKSFIRALDFS